MHHQNDSSDVTAPTSVTLIAVVGPVASNFLDAFLSHYERLGVSDALIAFHFTDDVPTSKQEELVRTLRSHGLEPSVISRGPWHETTNTEIRDRLRSQRPGAWHLIADVDEFVTLPVALDDLITGANADGRRVIPGVLHDRIGNGGAILDWDGSVSLVERYPLGGFLTHALLHGDPRKIVFAKPDADVAHGNHWSFAEDEVPRVVLTVNHFKWRDGIDRELRRRVAEFDAGNWVGRTDAVRDEAARFVGHLDENGGCVDLNLRGAMFAPSTVDKVRTDWQSTGVRVKQMWDDFFRNRSKDMELQAGYPMDSLPLSGDAAQGIA